MGIVVSYTPPRLDPAAFVEAAKTAAEVAGAEVLLKRSEPDVPYDTGALQASGHVEHGPDGAEVIYSAKASDGFDYAAIQHEREDFAHERGKAHYLGDQMHIAAAEIAAAIASKIKL